MGSDEARGEDVRAWLRKAELDLRAAAHEISAPDAGLSADVVFHAQQAAEKALKAFLACHDVPFRKTHNLEELGRECVALDATLQALADQAVPLTEYGWKFRYPGRIAGTGWRGDATSAGDGPSGLWGHSDSHTARSASVRTDGPFPTHLVAHSRLKQRQR